MKNRTLTKAASLVFALYTGLMATHSSASDCDSNMLAGVFSGEIGQFKTTLDGVTDSARYELKLNLPTAQSGRTLSGELIKYFRVDDGTGTGATNEHFMRIPFGITGCEERKLLVEDGIVQGHINIDVIDRHLKTMTVSGKLAYTLDDRYFTRKYYIFGAYVPVAPVEVDFTDMHFRVNKIKSP